MKIVLFVLCCSSSLFAQEFPSDAKSLLEYNSSTQHSATQQAYVYLSAGAGMQLQSVLDSKGELNNDDQRFQLQAACWDSHLHAAALPQAEAWLSANRHDAASVPFLQVEDIHNYLYEQQQRSSDIEAAILKFSLSLVAFAVLFVALIRRNV